MFIGRRDEQQSVDIALVFLYGLFIVGPLVLTWMNLYHHHSNKFIKIQTYCEISLTTYLFFLINQVPIPIIYRKTDHIEKVLDFV